MSIQNFNKSKMYIFVFSDFARAWNNVGKARSEVMDIIYKRKREEYVCVQIYIYADQCKPIFGSP